jgi:glycosyltransferase involved in cell wall biosynthesis
MVRISVVVPCYPPHQKMIPDFLKHLETQTVKPDEIIISLSEVTDDQVLTLRNEWQEFTSILFQVVGQEIKALAAVNRNYGAMHSICDYIQFLDADDIYHTKLIELVKAAIIKDQPDAILFHLSEDNIDIINNPSKCRSYSSQELFDNLFPDKERNIIKEQYLEKPELTLQTNIPHGNICVKYSVWEEMPQEDLEGREDSIYIRSLLWRWWEGGCKGSGVIILPEVLTYYKKNTHNIVEFIRERFK